MRKILFVLIISGVLAGCSTKTDNVATQKSETDSAQATQMAADGDPAALDTESAEAVLPFRREWDPGRSDESHPRSRFFAREYAPSKRVVILALDTLSSRAAQGTARRYVVADSLLVTDLRPGEFFSTYCGVGGSPPTRQVGGLGSNISSPKPWERARLGWRFDTAAVRIRLITSDSVSCQFSEPE
jgi:uncharacterized protein YceK